SKNNLYFNDLLPERFGRKRKYALGKTSGKANILKNLQELGLTLNPDELKKVTERIINLGDKKEKVTKEDLPYIISDVLDAGKYIHRVKIDAYVLTHAKGLQPSATVSLTIGEVSHEQHANGDGQFDAFMNALKRIYKNEKEQLAVLTDYAVRIPPGSTSDALCETIITWEHHGKEFITRGLDSDQTVSAIKATEKMLNIL
ncbi:MAG: alpha-isopropylmalate synthase regulatory domain-containing protein, partial [Flavobacteriaceae bacterium]|nr:alpha-isopropylmalate synthase regulatory domain-containing protein [Flavobacteriaceae bacterium]